MQLNETPTVSSDINGHHVKDEDGKVIQSFPRSPEGLKAAKEYMYKHHKDLSVSKQQIAQQQMQMQQALSANELPAESKEQDKTMTKLEEMYEKALNETVTISTQSNDRPDDSDTVKIDAQDASPDEIIDMLKMAGIDLSPEPVYHEVEAEPEMDINPIDDMANTISIIDLDGEMPRETPCGMEADVEEDTDYANAPDEVYGDADLQMSMAGGPNRPSNTYKHVNGGDNPMALEEDELAEELFTEYKGLAEEEVDEAIKIIDKETGDCKGACDDEDKPEELDEEQIDELYTPAYTGDSDIEQHNGKRTKNYYKTEKDALDAAENNMAIKAMKYDAHEQSSPVKKVPHQSHPDFQKRQKSFGEDFELNSISKLAGLGR